MRLHYKEVEVTSKGLFHGRSSDIVGKGKGNEMEARRLAEAVIINALFLVQRIFERSIFISIKSPYLW